MKLFSIIGACMVVFTTLLIQPKPLQSLDDTLSWQQGSHHFQYRVFAGGMEVAQSNFRYTVEQDRYEIFTEVEGLGLLKYFTGASSQSKSSGIFRQGKITALNFESNSFWRDERYNSNITFDGNTSAIFTYSPEKSAFNPNEYDPHVLKNTMDPSTMALVLSESLLKTGRCDIEGRAFTGRSRVDAKSVDLGEATLPSNQYSAYEGPIRLCEVSFTRIRPTKEAEKQRSISIKMYMAAPQPDNIPYPVLIEGTYRQLNSKIWLTNYRFEAS